MIYAASLALPAKKALTNKCQQTSINRIIELLPIDPETSKMEVVLLSARDLDGPFRQRVQSAIDTKHPQICVIYFYTSEKEHALLNCQYSKVCKKIKDDVISEAVTEFYGDHAIKTDKLELHSKDDRVVIDPIEEKPAPSFTLPEPEPKVEPEPAEETSMAVEEPILELIPTVDIPPEPQLPVEESLEDKIRRIANFHEWEYFKSALSKDSITRRLIEENTEYQGVMNMLEVFDVKIRDVFQDIHLSPDKKFEKIREFGSQRSVLKASENSIYSAKLCAIIEAIIESADKTVTKRIEELRDSVYKLHVDKKAIIEGVELQPLLNKRLDIQLELMEMLQALIETYKAMDATVVDQIQSLDKDLPTKNEFISEMMSPVKKLFLPENSPKLATLLMDSLQKGRVSMSALEQKINDIIALIFKICETDQEIINYQQNLISLLKAQRVEDVVIRDSLIKSMLHVFVGADDTGRTATAYTWAGMMSRRNNTLLVDLTANSQLTRYGAETLSLDEFMVDRRERQLLCVAGNIHNDPEEAFKLIQELRNRISYYSCVAIIVDDTQQDLLDQFSSDALTTTYITDCSSRSIEVMRDVIENHKTENVARKLVVIDSPVDVMEMLHTLKADMTTMKIIPLPYMRSIKGCAIKGMAPFKNEDILTVFEEAFR